MQKLALLALVVVIAALSVIGVSAAPRDRYYDQMGNKYWCNTDSYGCWVSGENGGKDYIMFWSESAAEAFMGKNSGAPIGTLPGSKELVLEAPKVVVADSAPVDKCKDATTRCKAPKSYCNPDTGACQCPPCPSGKIVRNEDICTCGCESLNPNCGQNEKWNDETCQCDLSN